VALRPGMTKVGHPIPEAFSMASMWNGHIKTIHERGHMTYRLTPDAYQEFRAFQHWYEQTKAEDRLLQDSDVYMTAFGKLEGLTGRIALMFHLLDDVTPCNDVPLGTMQRAIQVVKGYIIPSLRYSWGDLGGIVDDSFDYWLMNHILAKSGIEEQLTLRDLKHSARKQLGDIPSWQKDAAITDAMGLVESCKWVIRQEESYRKDHVVWFINPHLKDMYKEQRHQVLKIRQKRLDENREIARKAGRAVERRIVPGLDEFE